MKVPIHAAGYSEASLDGVLFFQYLTLGCKPPRVRRHFSGARDATTQTIPKTDNLKSRPLLSVKVDRLLSYDQRIRYVGIDPSVKMIVTPARVVEIRTGEMFRRCSPLLHHPA